MRIPVKSRVGEHHVQVMVVRNAPALDGLPGAFKGGFDPFGNESELALCLERQGASVKLVALPDLGCSGHGKHVFKRLEAILLGELSVAAQGVDGRTQCHKKAGLADAFARVAAFKIAPFVFEL